MKKAILYIRSTKTCPPAKQRPEVDKYLETYGYTTVAEEVERAGAKGFPALKRAIDQADGRMIIISNLGQLARSPDFLDQLRGCNFAALGQPDVRPDTLDVLVSAAEELAQATRLRVIEAMEDLKKKGVPLGSHRPGHTAGAEALRRHAGKGPKVAAQMRAQRAREYYQFVMPRIVQMREEGISYDNIAKTLNDEGLVMQNGKPYHEVSVLRLKQRWEKETKQKMAPEYDKPGRRQACS